MLENRILAVSLYVEKPEVAKYVGECGTQEKPTIRRTWKVRKVESIKMSQLKSCLVLIEFL